MRFTPCVYPKVYAREITPRRVACAQRAVQRDKDAIALFPELLTAPGVGNPAAHSTAAERLAAFVEGDQQTATEWRAYRARGWREARRALEALPALTRRGILAYWSRCNFPGDPAYLMTVIRDPRSGWTRLRVLRQMYLVGQGRLPRSVILIPAESKSYTKR